MKKFTLVLSVLTLIHLPALANEKGDANAGKAKAVVCSACHGVDGNSMINIYPKIAGQHANYLEKQLKDFRAAAKSGGTNGRMDPVMSSMSVALSDQDIADISAYYASQKQTDISVDNMPKLGEKLYKAGDSAKGITACIACHGPQGKGMGMAGFPMVSGQHSAYTKSQLTKFHNGSRNNDMNSMMRDVSKKLSPKDIEALSVYLSGLK